jgi:hypothetical protein
MDVQIVRRRPTFKLKLRNRRSRKHKHQASLLLYLLSTASCDTNTMYEGRKAHHRDMRRAV